MSKHRGFVLNSKQTLYFDGKKSSSFRTLTFDFVSSKHDGYVQVSKQTLYFDVKINIPDFMCLPSKLSSKIPWLCTNLKLKCKNYILTEKLSYLQNSRQNATAKNKYHTKHCILTEKS